MTRKIITTILGVALALSVASCTAQQRQDAAEAAAGVQKAAHQVAQTTPEPFASIAKIVGAAAGAGLVIIGAIDNLSQRKKRRGAEDVAAQAVEIADDVGDHLERVVKAAEDAGVYRELPPEKIEKVKKIQGPETRRVVAEILAV